MIISVPAGILLLLLNSSNINQADGAFMKPASSTAFRQGEAASATATPTQLYLDPIVEAYGKKYKANNPYDFNYSEPSTEMPVPIPDVEDIPTPEVVVPDVTGAVTTDTPPPPLTVPDVVPTPDVTDSAPTNSVVDNIVEAMNNAAATAIEASEKAAEAAATFSTSTSTPDEAATTAAAAATAAASTKAGLFPKATAAAAKPAVVAAKAPTLFEFVRDGKVTVPSGDVTAAVSSESVAKLNVLKENLINTGSTTASTLAKTVDASAAKVTATAAGASALTVAPKTPSFDGFDFSTLDFNFDFESIDVQTFINNLKLDEYGGWYATAFTFFYALNQKNVGRLQAEKEFETELKEARGKAEEAAQAALMAAEGAAAAKELVVQMVNDDKLAGASVPLSGSQLALAESKMKLSMIDYDMMKGTVEKLTAENRQQKVTIDKLIAEKSGPKISSKKAATKVVKENFTMDRDPKEEEKILEILKGIDEENALAQAAAAKKIAAEVKKSNAAAKKAEKAASSLKPKKKTAAKKKKAVTAKKTVVAAKKTVVAAKKKTAPKKKKTTRKKKKATVAKTAPTPEATPALVEEIMQIDASAVEEASAPTSDASSAVVEEIMNFDANADAFAAAVDTESLTSAPKAKAKKAPAKRKAVARKKVDISDPSINPWGSLKESTLKRKTIAQLSAYLADREVVIEGLSKTELVGTIQKL